MLGVTQLHFEEIPAALVADQPVWKLNKTIGAILQKLEPEIRTSHFRLICTRITARRSTR